MSSLLTKPLVQHHLSRVSPIQLRDFSLQLLVIGPVVNEPKEFCSGMRRTETLLA